MNIFSRCARWSISFSNARCGIPEQAGARLHSPGTRTPSKRSFGEGKGCCTRRPEIVLSRSVQTPVAGSLTLLDHLPGREFSHESVPNFPGFWVLRVGRSIINIKSNVVFLTFAFDVGLGMIVQRFWTTRGIICLSGYIPHRALQYPCRETWCQFLCPNYSW